jgi:hypothetical protein
MRCYAGDDYVYALALMLPKCYVQYAMNRMRVNMSCEMVRVDHRLRVSTSSFTAFRPFALVPEHGCNSTTTSSLLERPHNVIAMGISDTHSAASSQEILQPPTRFACVKLGAIA